jgi:hypothetical protein
MLACVLRGRFDVAPSIVAGAVETTRSTLIGTLLVRCFAFR